MREIKFRAWDKEKKWMVYDVQDAYDGLWSERNSDEINDYYDYSIFQDFTDEENFNLMQYTGLKDKNGVEIYEGDVVESPSSKTRYLVDYVEGRFVGRIKHREYTNLYKALEVIGNIYENPELLKEQNK